MMSMSGCSQVFDCRLADAERHVSAGQPLEQEFSGDRRLSSPSYRARLTLVEIMDGVLTGEYDPDRACSELETIRDDRFLPGMLRVEAGYLLVLIQQLVDEQQQCQQLLQQQETCGRENRELRYKLEKLQEIYLHTEKRRGEQ